LRINKMTRVFLYKFFRYQSICTRNMVFNCEVARQVFSKSPPDFQKSPPDFSVQIS
jgi:hypothetical protein